MNFVYCVLLVSLTNIVYCGNQSEEGQDEGFGYELLNYRIDKFQEVMSTSINRLVDLVTESKKNSEDAFIEMKANVSRMSHSLDRLENLDHTNQNKTEQSLANLKASIFTNNSRLVERIVELETFAKTMLNDQKLVDSNTRKLLKNQAKTTCLITGMSAVSSRKILCEMETFDGGWIVIQQRIDHKLDFNRSWTEYRDGFGTVGKDSDFWLGLKSMHLLTNVGNCELAVEMKEKNSGKYKYARYSKFAVKGEDDKYKLEVTGYSGTGGNQLERHNNMKFTTYDSDNDRFNNGNCAKDYGGWWFDACFRSALNFPAGGRWWPSKSDEYKLSYSRMMIRCE